MYHVHVRWTLYLLYVMECYAYSMYICMYVCMRMYISVAFLTHLVKI